MTGMNGRLKVVSIAGIPIYIHASWLLIYALITWTLAVGFFPQVLPDLPTFQYWLAGLIAALLLFASVLLHELSHSFVALAHGLSVQGITLHVFGGVSQLEDEPPTPRAEFLIAVVGPLTSLGLAAVLWAVHVTGVIPPGPPSAIVAYLVLVNVVVGIFNLIPGFPLDGGRILRAILWRWKGTLARATATASRVGVAVAYGLMGLGLVQILAGAFIGGLWLILIGLFLRSAADVSYVQTTVREALARLPVGDVMARDVVAVSSDATVAQLVDQFWQHHFTSFPVVDDGTVAGIATIHQVHDVSSERWAEARIRDVMRPLGDDLVVKPGDTMVSAFEKASRNGLGRLAVMDDRRLVGYLSLKDITHVLALRGMPAEAAPRLPLRRAA
jgi:Zn-dependent protease/CBS domain-containing protein